MFLRLGTWCHDRKWVVVGSWLGALLFGFMVAGVVGNGFRDEFNLPDVESRTGFDILDDNFGGQGTGITGTIVFQADQGVDDPQVREEMQALFDRVAELPNVERVESPYAEGGERQISSVPPNEGTIAFANVEMPDDIEFPDAEAIRNEIRANEPEIEGVDIELGGIIFSEFEEPSSEILGIAFAVVILIVAFGSVLAMGLPIGVALFGIGFGSFVLTPLLSNVLPVPDFATFLGTMIGLGVGIDYALLIVTRYREQLHAGHTVRESIGIALDTAGRAVLFAGTTVVISLLGMLVMQVGFVSGLAVAAAAVVAVSVVASLTLLPALIGLAGHRVELTRWRGLIAAGLVAVGLAGTGLGVAPLMIGFPLALIVLIAGWGMKDTTSRYVVAGLVVFGGLAVGILNPLALVVTLPVAGALAALVVKGGFAPLQRPVRLRPPKPRRETVAYRWSRIIQRRPWTSAIVGAAALLILAVPMLSLRLGFSDESNYDEETTTRQAYDLLVAGFGPGFNGPFILAAELPEGTDIDDLGAITEAVEADEGVAFVSPARPNDPENPTAAMWQLVPTSAPQDAETNHMVDRLRDDVLPPVEEQVGVEVMVTGSPAVNVDFSDYLAERLPYFFVAVLTLSFLLLMVVFRSVLVPLKAVIMNLLSISAAYGIVVALFQWGWLSDITGVAPAPIEPWAPMMLFAIVFGLSMDYEVFLLSRVREEWKRSGDSRTSVADGLAATAKVITAAAAIMVVVFGAFILENDRVVKLMGVGLASAILLDATIVRMLLVPATMELLGDRNWWLPRWLDRILPDIDVEGHAEPTDEGEAEVEPRREPEPVGAGS